MRLIPLSIQHAPELLLFEQQNRAWFEQHVEARPNDFYSLLGVQTHIAELLMDKALGKGIPTLLVDQHQVIVGRVNLANIGKGKAFLGYRLAHSQTGKGLAKQAVSMMIELAKQSDIQRVIGLTSVDNIASQHVLTSHRFVKKRRLEDFTVVNGDAKDCIEFWLDLIK